MQKKKRCQKEVNKRCKKRKKNEKDLGSEKKIIGALKDKI